MPAKVDVENCSGCGDCVEACPTGAVTLADEKANVSVEECIDCNACTDACTHNAMAIDGG